MNLILLRDISSQFVLFKDGIDITKCRCEDGSFVYNNTQQKSRNEKNFILYPLLNVASLLELILFVIWQFISHYILLQVYYVIKIVLLRLSCFYIQQSFLIIR